MEDPNNPRFQLCEAELMKEPMVIDESTKIKPLDNTRRVMVVNGATPGRTSRLGMTALLAAGFAAMGSSGQLAGRSIDDLGDALKTAHKDSPRHKKSVDPRRYGIAEISGTRAERRAIYLRRSTPASSSKLARKAAEHRLGIGHPR